METCPRPEHPDPQFMRQNWRNLNGIWEFEVDKSDTGEAGGFVEREHLSGQILVPFCPESPLSGVGLTDFMDAVWYKRRFSLTDEERRGDVLLHFGAVDYACAVYLNGQCAGRHKGGYSSFVVDVTAWAVTGENLLTVQAVDHTRSPMQPSGKQSELPYSHGCHYTRTTGIWQTVWLEFVPKVRLERFRLTPNAETGSVVIEAFPTKAGVLLAECFYEGRPMGSRRVSLPTGGGVLELELAETHLWDLGQGRLYDLHLTFGEDCVSTYFGLRSIGFDGMAFCLNGRPVFQRLVLDQGFYPDGIYTAPDDAALQQDIRLAQAMGFNGARLHEKVFEPRFLYHCDRAGYLVWGEYPNWGVDIARPSVLPVLAQEWLEVLQRDYNHPAIIGWCPLNETWDYDGRRQYDATLSTLYRITKAVDPTRPCIDTSGAYHVQTDVFCLHDYEQDPAVFKEHYDRLVRDNELFDYHAHRQTYRGEPVFLSEYGGTGWPTRVYGDAPQTPEAFLQRLEGLTAALMDNKKMCGLCYTQLYDVEQEVNGLYTYARQPKFPPSAIAAIFSRPAAIECQEP